MNLTQEQCEQVLRGMDIILTAVGAPTIEGLLKQNTVLLGDMSVDRQTHFMEIVKKQAATQIAETMSLVTENYTKAFDDAIALKQQENK
jgi:hypothetical protein